MELGLSGKRALVTGASRGIGFAIARGLAAEGCDVALAARNVQRLKGAVKAIRSEFRVGVTSHAMDLSVPHRQESLIDVVGDIDILVNNAGAMPPGDLASVDDVEWRQAWELKVFGTINLCRIVLPQMRGRGQGVIINVIGIASARPRPDQVVGASGEAALLGFTRAVGQQTPSFGVRVLAVSPGLVMTPRLEELLRLAAEERFGNAERWDELVPESPPPGDPSQVADVVAFLASERASFVSGTAVQVDGGANGA